MGHPTEQTSDWIPFLIAGSAMCSLNEFLTDLDGLSFRREWLPQAGALKGPSDCWCCFGQLWNL